MTNYPEDPTELKDITEFPNYQISKAGIVFNKITKKEMVQQIDREGYHRLRLSKENKKYTRMIHKLMATTFIGDGKPFDKVDHIDRNKNNNNLENLRYVSNFENAQNRGASVTNKSGFVGVIYKYKKDRNSDHWEAYITAYKKRYHKEFPYTDAGFELAKAWRIAKEKELFYTHL